MKRYWSAFCKLVFTRPLVFGFVMVLYAIGLALASLIPVRGIWMGVAISMGMATLFLFGLATERVSLYCSNAAELLLPSHARAMRGAQIMMLAVFAGGPIAVVLAVGDEVLLSIVAIVLAAALGTWVRGSTLLLPLVLLPMAIFAMTSADVSWIFLPWVQVVILAAASIQIARWLKLPANIEAQAGTRRMPLSDALHEQPPDTSDAVGSLHAPVLDGEVLELLKPVREKGLSIEALAMGLGFLTGLRWRAVFTGAAIAIAVLAVWQFIHAPRPDFRGYYLVCAGSLLTIYGRIAWIEDSWKKTAAEQALLTLMPAWPAMSTLRNLLFITLLRSQIGGWLVWLMYSAVALAASWVTFELVLVGAFAMFAVTCGSIAKFAALLARRAVHEWHWSSIGIVLSCAVGTITIGHNEFLSVATLGGLGLVVAPTAAALIAAFRRPLLFPIVVRVKG